MVRMALRLGRLRTQCRDFAWSAPPIWRSIMVSLRQVRKNCVKYPGGAFGQSLAVRAALDLGGQRRFVWIVHASHTVHFPSARAAIDSLQITAFTNIERRVHVNFEELTDPLADLIADRAVR